MKKPLVNVLVIDDELRFALHVFRNLGTDLSVGIGTFESSGLLESGFWEVPGKLLSQRLFVDFGKNGDLEGIPLKTLEDKGYSAKEIKEIFKGFFDSVPVDQSGTSAKTFRDLNENQKPDLLNVFEDLSQPKSDRLSEDGRIGFWWLPADELWQNRLEKVLAKCVGQKLIAFIDIYGIQAFPNPDRGAGPKYGYQNILNFLQDKRPDIKLQLISSYQVGDVASNLPVWPKSPETLVKICQRAKDAVRDEEAREPTRHSAAKTPEVTRSPKKDLVWNLLVTGAGFELRNPKQDSIAFGMPSTGDLLREFAKENGIFQDWKTHPVKGLPYPRERNVFGNAIEKMAANSDLDSFWDIFFEMPLKNQLSGASSPEERDSAKIQAYTQEYSLRNTFREVFLKYDTGYLNHYLLAAGLHWNAWLTTNYTHFVNRAIDLVRADSKPAWRIISTSTEAQRLQKEALYPSVRDPGDIGKKICIFKLHGDISHLHTMAIAGHDKDLFNPLSFQVDALHEVYNTAERHLELQIKQKLKEAGGSLQINWHIIGHGMQDRLLVSLIKNVLPENSSYILVGPDPLPAVRRLHKAIEGEEIGDPAKANPPFYSSTLTAAEYMARVSLRELPKGGEDLTNWLDSLG